MCQTISTTKEPEMNTGGRIAAVIGGTVLVCAAIGGGLYYYYNTSLNRPLDEIENEVKGALSDPESARFSRVVINKETKFACGYVNSKNNLGGYTGNRMFVAGVGKGVEMAPIKQSTGAPKKPQTGNWENDVLQRARDVAEWSVQVQADENARDGFIMLLTKRCPEYVESYK
jgi:hypothetical protein